MKKIAIIAVIAALAVFAGYGGRETAAATEPAAGDYDFGAFRDGSYYRVARAWESEHEPAALPAPLFFPTEEGAVALDKNETYVFTVLAPETGLYHLGLSFKPEDGLTPRRASQSKSTARSL